MSFQLSFFLSGLGIQLSDIAAAEMLLRFFEVCNPLALASQVAALQVCTTVPKTISKLAVAIIATGVCVWEGVQMSRKAINCPALSLSICLWNMPDVSVNLKVGSRLTLSDFPVLASETPRVTGTCAVTQHEYWASNFQVPKLAHQLLFPAEPSPDPYSVDFLRHLTRVTLCPSITHYEISPILFLLDTSRFLNRSRNNLKASFPHFSPSKSLKQACWWMKSNLCLKFPSQPERLPAPGETLRHFVSASAPLMTIAYHVATTRQP